VDCGLTYNGKPAQPSQRNTLSGSVILASRSEIKRGEWQQFEGGDYQIRPMGSVAYKLALVAAGRADLTFTLTPKHEWDVVAGVALVESGGGFVSTIDQTNFVANRRNPLLPGLLASGPFLQYELLAMLRPQLEAMKQNR
jgi:myo-inositol-1(or 4)-monophosphatase